MHEACTSGELVEHFGTDRAQKLANLFEYVQGAVRETFFMADGAASGRTDGDTSSYTTGMRVGRPKNNVNGSPTYFTAVPGSCFSAQNGIGAPVLSWASIASQPAENKRAYEAWRIFVAKGIDKGYFDDGPNAVSWAKLPEKTVCLPYVRNHFSLLCSPTMSATC